MSEGDNDKERNFGDGDSSRPVPVIGGAALKAALDEIFLVFGGVGRLYALSDLEGQGIRFDDSSLYTLEQLKRAFCVMGPEVADMVAERLQRKMAAPDC